MKQNYDEALRRLLADEGGYTNHPADPGGPTNFGITITDYRKYIKPNATAADVRAMTLAEAKSIYRARYWDSQRCDDLPPGVDYAIFDYGVNSGIGRSGKVLRRILKMPADTSVITPDVVSASFKVDAEKLSDAINDERLAFLKSLKTWSVFGGGWGRRVAGAKATCRVMARNAKAPVPTPLPQVNAPSVIPAGKGEVQKPPTKTIVATGGAAGTGALAWLQAHPAASVAIAIGIIAAIGGVVYFLNQRRTAKQEAPAPGWQAPALPAAA